jgi:hypothetical protein
MKMLEKLPLQLANEKNGRSVDVLQVKTSAIEPYCHRKHNFDQKWSSAQFEGNNKI